MKAADSSEFTGLALDVLNVVKEAIKSVSFLDFKMKLSRQAVDDWWRIESPDCSLGKAVLIHNALGQFLQQWVYIHSSCSGRWTKDGLNIILEHHDGNMVLDLWLGSEQSILLLLEGDK